MGIVSKYVDKRIEHKLVKIGNSKIPLVLFEANKNTRDKRLLENKAWYSGDERALRNFYKDIAPSLNAKNKQQNDDSNYFWSGATNEIRKISAGFAPLISNTMGNILFASGIKAEGFKTVADEETMKDIEKDNKMLQLFHGGAVGESWAGYAVAKIVMDIEVTPYPILKFVKPLNVQIKSKHNRVIEYRFLIEQHTDKKKHINVYEIYGWDKERGAFIEYQAVKEETNKEPEVLTFKDAGLDPTDFETLTFPGMDRPLAFYKPNKTPNNEVQDSFYGASDYAGLQSEYDALDEVISTWIDDVRNGRTIFGVPESMVAKDLMGRNQAYNRFTSNMITTKSSVAAEKGEEVDRIETLNPDIDISRYLKSMEAAIALILRHSALSPVTIGINGDLGANSSSEARKDAERQTIKTRDMKANLWTPFIEDIYKTMLQVNDWANNKSIGQYDISITFNEYIDSTLEERLETGGKAIGDMMMSVEKAIDYAWRDELSEEDKEEEIERIKMQNGINDEKEIPKEIITPLLPPPNPDEETDQEDEEVIEEETE